MKRFSLLDRDRGFTDFERELMRTDEMKGFVHWISADSFVLQYSPFTIHHRPFICRIMDPMIERPLENNFVEVEGRIKRDRNVTVNDGLPVAKETIFLDVERIIPLVFNPRKPHQHAVTEHLFEMFGLEPPVSHADDFIFMIESHWTNTENENVGLALALQLVSCPYQAYGYGGIGLTPFSYHSKHPKKRLIRFKSIVRSMIPRDFTRGHTLYTHCFIDGPERFGLIRRARRRSPEVGYNHLFRILNETEYPTQIPLVMLESQPKKSLPEMGPDFYNYYLTALMMQSHIKEEHLNMFRRGKRELEKSLSDTKTPISVILDPNAINRLSMSFYRLHLATDLDDFLFDKARRFVMDNVLDFEYKYRDILKESEGATYDRGVGYATERLPWHVHEDSTVFAVYAKVKELREETGQPVLMESLYAYFDRKVVTNALEVLWNKGKLFQIRDGIYDVV